MLKCKWYEMAVIMARHFHHKPNKYLVYRKIMLTQFVLYILSSDYKL
jgi:hypothetical protein